MALNESPTSRPHAPSENAYEALDHGQAILSHTNRRCLFLISTMASAMDDSAVASRGMIPSSNSVTLVILAIHAYVHKPSLGGSNTLSFDRICHDQHHDHQA